MRLARGRALLTAGRVLEAIELLQAEMQTRPDDIGVIGALAAALCTAQRFQDAHALIDDAERRLPKHNRVQLFRAEIHAARRELPGRRGGSP